MSDNMDQDALAAEWEAMAEDGDDLDLASEWEAMVGGDDDSSDLPQNSGAAERILNQDEIDSLLGFSLSDDDAADKSGIRAIINSALVSYERLPMLEIVFDRLVRLMTTSLRNFTSDNVEVSLDNISSIRFGDYLNSIPGNGSDALIDVIVVEACIQRYSTPRNSGPCLLIDCLPQIFDLVDGELRPKTDR